VTTILKQDQKNGNQMKRFFSILTAVLVMAGCGPDTAPTTSLETIAENANVVETESRPNIIFIIADDLGFGDIGVNGSETIATPNIDALANSGVNFSTGYVTAAVCSPSRAAIMTGRHQQSFGFEYNPRARKELGIPVELDTLADRIREQGYATALIGKWHLGATPEHHPMERGFDKFFGFTGGGNGYLLNADDGEHLQDPVPGSRLGFKSLQWIERDGEPLDPDADLTTMLSREAVDFVEAEAHTETPFFLVLTHFAPHSPLQATDAQLDPYRHIEDKPKRIYSAMVTALDDGIGDLVEALERTGQRDNTFILFMSDNGCAHYIGPGVCSNAPFQGYKGTYFEGGVRVPMIANWPGVLEGGRSFDEPVVSYDWSVTALSIVGAEVEDQGFDGLNLMPFLTTHGIGSPRSRMHWRTLPNFAIRDGDWKLWMVERTDGSGMQPLLFNLDDDPGETHNLADEHPEELARLIAVFNEWSATLPDPAFESNRKDSFPLPDGMELSVYN
jgi:arylsulfatase A-like enzyme